MSINSANDDDAIHDDVMMMTVMMVMVMTVTTNMMVARPWNVFCTPLQQVLIYVMKRI